MSLQIRWSPWRPRPAAFHRVQPHALDVVREQPQNRLVRVRTSTLYITSHHIEKTDAGLDGNAEIAGLDNGGPDVDGLDIDGRMCGQLTELKLQNFIP